MDCGCIEMNSPPCRHSFIFGGEERVYVCFEKESENQVSDSYSEPVLGNVQSAIALDGGLCMKKIEIPFVACM